MKGGGALGGSEGRLGNDLYLRVNANLFLTVIHTLQPFRRQRLAASENWPTANDEHSNFAHKSFFFLLLLLLLFLLLLSSSLLLLLSSSFKDLILNSTRLHASTKDLLLV